MKIKSHAVDFVGPWITVLVLIVAGTTAVVPGLDAQSAAFLSATTAGATNAATTTAATTTAATTTTATTNAATTPPANATTSAAPAPAPTSAPANAVTPTATTVTPDPTATTVTPDPTAATVTPDPTATTVTPDPTATTVTPDPTATTVDPTPMPTTTDPSATPSDPSATPVDPSASPTDPLATPSPTPGPLVTTPGVTGLFVDHVVLGTFDGPGLPVQYLPPDTNLTGAQPLQHLRVRFRLHNAGPDPLTLSPQLDAALASTLTPSTLMPVAQASDPDAVLQLEPEWVSAGRGTELGPELSPIEVTEFELVPLSPLETVIAGERSAAVNPAPDLVIAVGAATEVEFSLQVGLAAPTTGTYMLVLSNAGTALQGTGTMAQVSLMAAAALAVTPGQQTGVDVPGPSLLTPAEVRAARDAAAANAPAIGPEGIHGPYRLTSDVCTSCHQAHSGQGEYLLKTAGPQKAICFSCHDGTGARANVQGRYSDPAVAANDSAGGSIYRHETSEPSTMSPGALGLGTTATCSACHNAHKANASPPVQTAEGWTPSGAIDGAAGVAVTNGGAGTTPSYTALDGDADPVLLEYQLCFRCHSSAANQRSNAGVPASRQALDLGVEFNPSNGSFHPIEAAGTNRSATMAASLAGPSPYKLWNFTVQSTLRCVNCHTDSANGTTATLAADGSLTPHVSENRSILIRPYRDRLLLPKGAAYDAGNFALCFTCHAEAPFTGSSSSATSFRLHSMHLNRISGEGNGGTDIDTAGAGQGNAICAECHFRLHSVAGAVGSQTTDGSRLVNFAPNVTPNGGVLSWTRTASGGNCTLTCHGEGHNGEDY